MTIIESLAVIIQAWLVSECARSWSGDAQSLHRRRAVRSEDQISQPPESRGKPVQSTITVLGAHFVFYVAFLAASSVAYASQGSATAATLDTQIAGAIPCERLVDEDFKNTFEAPLSVLSAKLVPAKDGTAEYCAVNGVIQPQIQFEVRLPSKS